MRMQRFIDRMHSIPKQTQTLDLQELITRCLSGNPDAQKILFNKFATPMARLCIRYLKDHETARDVMMEAFMKVFDKLKHFEYQGEHSLGMWIRKIMVNECLMRLRKDRTRFYMDITDQAIETTAPINDLSADDILALIDTLPAGYRTVFNLYAIDGYSHKEIATLLEITESASRSQLTHARAKLQELLRKRGWS